MSVGFVGLCMEQWMDGWTGKFVTDLLWLVGCHLNGRTPVTYK